jgi:hypothetical protein
MKPEMRPIAKLTAVSTAALFLLAAPFAVDWRTLDIDTIHAQAKGDGEGKGGKGGGEGTSGSLGGAVGAVGGAIGGAVGAVGDAVGGVADGVGDALGGDTSAGSGEADSSDSGDAAGDSDSGAASGDSGSGAGSGDAGSGDAAGDSDSGAASGDSGSGAGSGDAGSGDAAGDSGSGNTSGSSGSGTGSGDSASGEAGGESDSDNASSDSGSSESGNSSSGSGGSSGGAGGAIGGAAGAVGDGVGGVADGVGDALGGAASSDGETGTADVGAPDSSDVAEPGTSPDADDAGAGPSLTDTVSETVESAGSTIDDAVDATSEAPPAIDAEASIESSTSSIGSSTSTSTSTSVTSSSRSAGKAAVSRARVTVSVRTVRLNPARRGGDGDKHRLAGSSGAASARVIASDNAALGLAAIEPSAGRAVTGAVPPARSASLGCAAADGRGQGVAISCHIPGSKDDAGARQIAYAPPDAAIDGGTPGDAVEGGAPAAAIDGLTAPAAAKLPGGRSFYDELYGLQQVEARRYADGGVPVLVVQGIVSNMSDGRRPVPRLLAIVQDEDGKELMRWSFRAEADALAPGGSTGFRSEMLDPQSQSANVTIVFAAEQQTMR